jgi:DUF2939 family protein
MSRRYVLVGLSVILVAGAGLASWRYWKFRRSPTYSLQQLAHAAKVKDRLAVEEYVDIHRLAQSVADDFVAAVTAEVTQRAGSQTGFEALGMVLGLRMIEGMKPVIVSTIEQAIAQALGDSTIVPATTERVPGLFDRGGLDLRGIVDRYEGLGRIQQRGNVALAEVKMRLTNPDTLMIFTLRMESADGHWQVIAIDHLAAQLQTLGRSSLDDAYVASMKRDLRNLVTAEEAYFADSVKYTSKIGRGGLLFSVTTGNTLPIIRLTDDGWTATIRSTRSPKTCAIFIGSTRAPPATREGEPTCQ